MLLKIDIKGWNRLNSESGKHELITAKTKLNEWIALVEEKDLSVDECEQVIAARKEFVCCDKNYAQDIKQKARVK